MYVCMFDFINLAHVHNYTVGAKDIFIVAQILIFSIRFKETEQ